MTGIAEILDRGGPVLWLIAALSVGALAFILWKVWRLALMGAWSGGPSERAATLWAQGDRAGAEAAIAGRRSLRATLLRAAMAARTDPALNDEQAREETARVARAELARARSGLRLLDLVVTIAPLLGLLGTVLGMIAAFQTLQQSGAQADPSDLAGGIWEALLTTAAGMGVAIPASMALSWFESVVDRVQADMEDLATRIFTRGG
jgi:biopolymer transport protein ExbB